MKLDIELSAQDIIRLSHCMKVLDHTMEITLSTVIYRAYGELCKNVDDTYENFKYFSNNERVVERYKRSKD